VQPETSFRIRPVQARLPSADTHRDGECLPKRLRGKVDVRIELRQMFCFLTTYGNGFCPRQQRTPAFLVDCIVNFSFEAAGVFKIDEAALECRVEDFSHRTEIVSNRMDFVDDICEKTKVGIVVACEVEDRHIARLPVAVEAAVALFESRRIPCSKENLALSWPRYRPLNRPNSILPSPMLCNFSNSILAAFCRTRYSVRCPETVRVLHEFEDDMDELLEINELFFHDGIQPVVIDFEIFVNENIAHSRHRTQGFREILRDDFV
jgi:hypothetical protein